MNLKELARICGVDASTVSRALKNDPRISETTALKVREAALKHDYQPNIAARMLKEGHSRIFWMLVPTIGSDVDWRIAERATFSAAKRGYDVAVMVHHSRQEDFERIVQTISSGLAAGAIINRRDIRNIASVKSLIEGGFPVVFVDVPVYSLELGIVTTDHRQATQQLVNAACKGGAQQFLFLFDRLRNRVDELRYEGAVQAISRLGLRALFVEHDPDWRQYLQAEGTLAIVASSQERVESFARKHEDVISGRDVVVACFDPWRGSTYPYKECYTGLQDYDGLADTAIEHLFALIDKKTPEKLKELPLSEIRYQAGVSGEDARST